MPSQGPSGAWGDFSSQWANVWKNLDSGREKRGNQGGFYLELMSSVRLILVHCLQLSSCQCLAMFLHLSVQYAFPFLSLPVVSLFLCTSLTRVVAPMWDSKSKQQEQRLPSELVFPETQLPDESACKISPSFDSVWTFLINEEVR